MDLGFLQEINLTDGVYTCGPAGNSVIAMDAPIQRHNGVTVFYYALLRFSVNLLHQLGPNVFRFQLATGCCNDGLSLDANLPQTKHWPLSVLLSLLESTPMSLNFW